MRTSIEPTRLVRPAPACQVNWFGHSRRGHEGPWHALLLAFCRRYANNPRPTETASALLPDLNPDRIADRLEQEGWADGIQIPAGRIARIREFTDELAQPRCDDAHEQCEALREVAYDPKVLEVVRRYFRAEPIVFHSVIWRNVGLKSIACAPKSHIYRFHFDVADVRSADVLPCFPRVRTLTESRCLSSLRRPWCCLSFSSQR